MPVRAVAKVFVILLAEEVARLVRGDDCLCGCDATVVCVMQVCTGPGGALAMYWQDILLRFGAHSG